MIDWFVLDLNPEPWAIGPVYPVRQGGRLGANVGRNQQLAAYQEAVREELGPQTLREGEHVLHLYFWRQRADYRTARDQTHRKHDADLTNLQKGIEDALQGVLFANDRDVRKVHAELVAQGPEVEPRIVIGIEQYKPNTTWFEVIRILANHQLTKLNKERNTSVHDYTAPGEDVF